MQPQHYNKDGNKMRTVRVKLYSFSELGEDAKLSVLSDHITDMMTYEHSDHYENWPEYKKAIDKAESMQTPWFAGCYVNDYCGKDIIAMLTDDKECKYTRDGKYF